MLEEELKAGGACGKNCYWITCSLVAGACMGTGSFIFASEYSELGYEGGGLCGPGVFIVFLLVWVIRESIFRVKNGKWTKSGDESRLIWGPNGQGNEGKVKWSNMIPLIGNISINVGYLVVMTYAWYFAELGGLNQGVISALLALASLINVISFYFGFGEKISYVSLVGVIFMVASILCIGAAAGSKGTDSDDSEEGKQDDGGRSKAMNAFLGVLIGLGGPTIISA